MDYLRYYLGPAMVLAGIVGFALGGQWVWLGAATILVVLGLDLLLGKDLAKRRVDQPLLVAVPLYLHVVLLTTLYLTMCWRFGQGWGEHSGLAMVSIVVGSVVSLAWLSAIPNVPVAHELGHRPDKFSQFLADYLAVFFADPTRWISHNMGHHLLVSTTADSDTARRGESVYRFIGRATVGAWHEAWQAETGRLKNLEVSVWSPKNRIARAAVMLALFLLVLMLVGGWQGLLIGVAGVLVSKGIVEGLNYLQHYGLIRETDNPFEIRHAWNHLSWASRAAAMEITTHSEHHLDSDLDFTHLTPLVDAPQMPSAALCFICATIPPVWERFIARPRLREWDEQYASSAEREMGEAANRQAGWV